MFDLLKMGRQHGYGQLREAGEAALASGSHDVSAIRYLLTAAQTRQTAIPAIEVGLLDPYERPLPVMNDYDQLLGIGAARIWFPGILNRTACRATARTSSSSATNSTGRSPAIRFQRICRLRRLFRRVQQHSTCSRGCRILASQLAAGSAYRFSGYGLVRQLGSADYARPRKFARSWKAG
jgi:hypothetical protein